MAIETTQEWLYELACDSVATDGKDAATLILQNEIQKQENINAVWGRTALYDKNGRMILPGDVIVIKIEDDDSRCGISGKPLIVTKVMGYHNAGYQWMKNIDSGFTASPVRHRKRYGMNGNAYNVGAHSNRGMRYIEVKSGVSDAVYQDALRHAEHCESADLTDDAKNRIADGIHSDLENGLETVGKVFHNLYHGIEILGQSTDRGRTRSYEDFTRLHAVSDKISNELDELREVMETYMIAEYLRDNGMLRALEPELCP